MSAVQAKRKATSSSENPPSKKRAVTVQTVEKWKLENDKAIGTALLLQYDNVCEEVYIGVVSLKREEEITTT